MNDIHEIINRLIFSLGYKTKKELAKALEISQSDLANRTKSGSIKQLLIDHAIHKKVNIDWLLKGEGPIFGVAESQPPYMPAPVPVPVSNESPPFDLGELIKLTTNVLLSKTKYAKALKENIEAFDEAVNERKRSSDPTDAAPSGSGSAE
jgi:hypothetical protein